MKKFLIFLTLFSMPVISAFAWPNLPDLRDWRGCRNSDQISYQAQELARETRQLADDRGRGGRWGNRFADEARRLVRATMELAHASRSGTNCQALMRIFTQRVEPAFRDLQEEARGPRRDDVGNDLRDIRRAFQDLRRELFDGDDNGRGPRGPGRDDGRGPGNGDGRGPGHGDGRGPGHDDGRGPGHGDGRGPRH